MNIHTRISSRISEQGQSIILIAFAFIGLLAFVGLTMDAGQLYVYIGNLRRACDAGSLAAADQYRKDVSADILTEVAEQVMNLNGVDPVDVTVETCATNPLDPELCFTPPRKMVRVIGEMDVPMLFLNIIGIGTVHISSDAIGEAAAMDIVLVIDISESMASDSSLCDSDDDDEDGVADDGRPADFCPSPRENAITPVGPHWDNAYADASACNPSNECRPMAKVKEAAIVLIDNVLTAAAAEEPDRIAIVAFSNGWQNAGNTNKGTHLLGPPVAGNCNHMLPGWISDHDAAVDTINCIDVYQPPKCLDPVTLLPYDGPGPCLQYDTTSDPGFWHYLSNECPWYRSSGDPSTCTTTNIGGGLRMAGSMFSANTREEALWVVILVTDGAANASDIDLANPYGYCPDSTWNSPFCRNRNSSIRHTPISDPNYDANDYARDMADYVGCYGVNPKPGCHGVAGQGAVIYTIGLGQQVLTTYSPDPIPHGVGLLRYIAAVGDDGDPDTDPCSDLYHNTHEFKIWCGNYYFSPSADELNPVFDDIASRIFTRLTH